MRKTFKTLTAAAIAFCIVFSGCQSFDDLIPSEYGEWDNHYIYRGNVRSKTTGEEWEYLVTEVETDTRIYTVQSCKDYVTRGDDIYMCLSLTYTGQEIVSTNSIVKYNVQSKTQETLCVYEPILVDLDGAGTVVNYNPYAIEGISQDGLLLCGRKESATYGEEGVQESYAEESVYYYMDFEGNVIEELPYEYYLSYARANDTYWWNTKWEDNEWSLYYATRELQEPVFVCKKNTHDYTYGVIFVEKQGAVGFLIETFEREANGIGECPRVKLEFYNLKTNAFTTLYEGEKYVDWVELPQNEYFVAYDYQTITYRYRDGLFSPQKQERVQMKTNCTLYQVVYSEQGAELKTVHSFGERKNLTDIRAIANGKAIINGIWYVDARGCVDGGAEQGYYELELSLGKLSEINVERFRAVEEECIGYYARQKGEACGEYIYYVQKEKLSAFMAGTSYAYLLKRYNATSGKTEVMQLWAEYTREGEKYCEEMWKRVGGDIEEFIVRNY